VSAEAQRWIWVPFQVDKKFDGYRIDRFLAQRLIGYSRRKVQNILAQARVLKEDRPAKANTKVRTGEKIHIAYLRHPEEPLSPEASLPLLFEDEDLLIVNKPADLLSHPTDKIVHHTVLGVLRQCRPDLPKLHLLHRLDRETSGVLALAKNPVAARIWTRNMEQRKIHKEYIAVVRGIVSPREGVIDMPIGREGGSIRVRQRINVPGAVPAVTRYKVLKRIPSPLEGEGAGWGGTVEPMCPPPQSSPSRGEDISSIVRVFPQTGRLHQIRVHFAAIGHPLLGDPLYTGEGEIYKKMVAGQCTESDRDSLGFPRVALHAAALTFPHPTTKRELHVEAPLPRDMDGLISDKLMPV
jgi:23S rRNA pseudouridine1911/1915/1917 synthase